MNVACPLDTLQTIYQPTYCKHTILLLLLRIVNMIRKGWLITGLLFVSTCNDSSWAAVHVAFGTAAMRTSVDGWLVSLVSWGCQVSTCNDSSSSSVPLVVLAVILARPVVSTANGMFGADSPCSQPCPPSSMLPQSTWYYQAI